MIKPLAEETQKVETRKTIKYEDSIENATLFGNRDGRES
jgi:hypothetical protein